MQNPSSMRGHIFACTTKTEKECLDRMLFASNKVYENKVMNVKKDDLLFLFNIDTKILYGLFRAKTDGAKNIVKEAWKGNYPYQVQVRRYGKTKSFEDAHKILARLGIQWHKSLDKDMLEMLLRFFNKKGMSWGSLMPDINKTTSSRNHIDDKPKEVGQQYPHNVDAIIFINSASKRIPDKDLEKHYTTRKIAASEGIAALAEWNKENNKDAKKSFEDQKTWNYFKKIFTKTSVEGFVAATKALYTMPDGKEDVTLGLKDSRIKLFGIVANDDRVFLKLMYDMKKDIPVLQILSCFDSIY